LSADAVVLAVPPANIDAVVADSPGLPPALLDGLATLTAGVVMAPCQAALIRLHAPIPFADEAAALDGLFANDVTLAWLCRENSKPGRPQAPASWTAHATVAWSRDHLEAPPEAVAEALRAAFVGLLQPLAAPGFRVDEAIAGVHTHRWRYALPEVVHEAMTWRAPTLRLVVAGDWCAGPRVEGAWHSGRAAAAALIEDAAHTERASPTPRRAQPQTPTQRGPNA
jgi:predicted NAD/FAD-dependent oxidoreductase